MAIRQLTVKERILLHLFDFNRYVDEYEVPLEVSQSGIASAVGIRVHHATQYLRPLIEADLVEEGVRHIQRQARRRKTYFLSPRGRQEASSLRTSLFEEPVPFHHRSGKADELTLAQVYQEERRGSPLVELVRELGETGFLTGQPEEGPSELVDFSAEAPPVDRFYGREEELAAVSDALEKAPIVVLTGLAGIGKSTLAAKVVEARRGEISLFWREVRPWDSASDLGLRLGAFLQAMGRAGLHNHLLSGGAMDLNRVEEILTGDLAEVPALMVFDDVHDASPEVLAFFSMMHRTLKRRNGLARALFLSRSRPGFYAAAKAELEASLREIPLKGLSDETSHRFLADQGLPEDVASSLVPVSGGSPLFLKLLAKAAEAGSAERARGSLEAHIAEEIEPSLGEGEREILQLASLYAVPVPSEALLLGTNAEARHLVALEAKNLLDRFGDGLLVAHDFLRDYFGKGLPFDRRADLSSRAASWLAKTSDYLAGERTIEGAISLMENAVAIEPDEAQRASYDRYLGDLREAVGDWTGALEAYRSALAGLPDPAQKARIHQRTAYNLRTMSRLEEGRRELERGLTLLPPGPSVEAALLLLGRAVDEIWTERSKESFRTLEKVGSWLPNLPRDPELRYWWTDIMGTVSLSDPSRRDYSEVLRRARDAIELYEEGDLPFHVRHFIQSYFMAAWASFLLGQMDEALSYLDRGWADIEATGGVVERGNHLNVKGYILSEGLGHFEEAEGLYNEALRWMNRTNQGFRSFWFPFLYAGLYRRQGRPEDARESLGFFLAKGEDVLETEDLIDGHAFMARLCVECGDPDAAEAHLSQTEGLLEKTDSESARFSVAWARAVVSNHRGEDEMARRSFDEALSLDPPPYRGVMLQKQLATEFLRGEFSLDYGRFLASVGETEEATDILKKALEEARAGGRKPL
ncbi:MAG: AAA family ATPase, partial [Candidatus Thermoplasmatota archaeon]|nr:AAA family ATPase [Candidatus Thermoplasmatota archaeon]